MTALNIAVALQVLLIQTGSGQDQHGTDATVSLDKCSLLIDAHACIDNLQPPSLHPVACAFCDIFRQCLKHSCRAISQTAAVRACRDANQSSSLPALRRLVMCLVTAALAHCSFALPNTAVPRRHNGESGPEAQSFEPLQVPNGYHGLKLSVRIGVPDPVQLPSSDLPASWPTESTLLYRR